MQGFALGGAGRAREFCTETVCGGFSAGYRKLAVVLQAVQWAATCTPSVRFRRSAGVFVCVPLRVKGRQVLNWAGLDALDAPPWRAR